MPLSIPQKQCSDCRKFYQADKSHFYSDRSKTDGLSTKCKSCKNKGNNKYGHSLKGKLARKKAVQKYRTTANGKRIYRDSARSQREKYPEKAKARDQLSWLVRSGKIPKARDLMCYCCGQQASEYHHPDYNKPLDVVPVCLSCHAKLNPAYIPNLGYKG